MVDDETLFRTMEVAAETGALVMVHAENGDAIDVLVKQALAEGKTEPKYHALTRPPETEGEATNRAIQLARVAGAPLYVVHVSCQRGGRADRARPREGVGRLGRDVHAVLLRRLHVPRAARLRGREVRLHAAAADEGEPGGPLERGAHRRALGRSRPTTARSSGTGRRRSAATTSRRSRTGARAREPAADDPRVRRARRAGSRSTGWSSSSVRTRRSSSASTRARARSRSDRTRTSSSSIPSGAHTISAATQHSRVRLQPLRGHRGHGLAGGRPPARQVLVESGGSSRSRESASSCGGPGSASNSTRGSRRRQSRGVGGSGRVPEGERAIRRVRPLHANTGITRPQMGRNAQSRSAAFAAAKGE